MFEKKGIIVIENDGLDEEKVMDDCMEAGAADFDYQNDIIEIVTDPNDFDTVRHALEAKGYTFASAQIEQVPSTYTALNDEESRIKMNRLIDALEDNDDVQEIWHNWENPDEE